MPPLLSNLRTIVSLASSRYGVRHIVGSSKTNARPRTFCRIRCFDRVASLNTDSPLARRSIRNHTDCFSSSSSLSSFIHSRQFLGCGDGEEGVLSKIYEERTVIGYSPEQLFDVVAAVDLYHGFVPWCQRSEILKYHPDGSFDAELEIGFKFLVESYVSRVELNRPKVIKTTVSESSLFDHLINIWEFNPGPVPGSCDLYFLVDFKFQSPLYRQIASMFFKEVVSKLVGSFSERCRLIYGPKVRAMANEQRT